MYDINYDLILFLLATASLVSTFTLVFIQKTKGILKKSRCIPLYALIINLIGASLFCASFTNISILYYAWVGVFAWLGADQLYKTFEEKLNSHKDILNKNTIKVPSENKIEVK